ncbi:Putative bacteriophage protein [Yersinia phage fEV-1]|nr:Putative bacteriophage protein [Yersinia phage fEV-1]
MAVVNEVVTRFSFEGDLKPQRDFNQGLTSSIKLLSGMAAGVTAAAGAMFAWASSVFDSLDPMVQLSRETGAAIEAIQELGFVASVNGSSAQALQSSIAGLSRSIGDAARGMGRGKQAFEDLDISIRDANGQVKTADVMLEELRMRFDQLGLSMDEQRSIAVSLGIDSSLIQMLNLTGEEMDSLQARARRLGVVTEEQGDAVAAYNDSMTTLRFGMQGIQNMVAVGFAPAMGDLVERFVELLEANHDLIVNGLTWLGDVVTSTVGMLQRMWPVFAAIAAGFVIAKVAAIGFGGVMSVVLSPVVLITAALVAAILIIDDLIVAFQGGKSVIADFFESFFGIDIRPALQAIVAAVMEMVDLIVRLFAPAVDAVMSMFKAIVALIKGDFSGAWGHITDGLSSMLEFWSGLFTAWRDGVVALIEGIANLLVAGLTMALDTLADAFQAWIDWISGLFGRMLDGIMGMWGRVTDYLKSKMMNILPNWAVRLIGGGGGDAVDEETIRREAEAASTLTAGFDRNEAVDRGTTQQSWNSNIDQNVEIHIATNDPQRAGAAVQDALQQQLKDSRTMSNRGGM